MDRKLELPLQGEKDTTYSNFALRFGSRTEHKSIQIQLSPTEAEFVLYYSRSFKGYLRPAAIECAESFIADDCIAT
jgi:hypothetical protein